MEMDKAVILDTAKSRLKARAFKSRVAFLEEFRWVSADAFLKLAACVQSRHGMLCMKDVQYHVCGAVLHILESF